MLVGFINQLITGGHHLVGTGTLQRQNRTEFVNGTLCAHIAFQGKVLLCPRWRACHERKRGWGRRRGRGADTKSTDPHLTDGGHVKHEKLQGKRKDIQAHERKRKWKENNRKNEWRKKQETKGRGRERTRCWLLFQSFRRGLHQKVMTGCICAYCQIWK